MTASGCKLSGSHIFTAVALAGAPAHPTQIMTRSHFNDDGDDDDDDIDDDNDDHDEFMKAHSTQIMTRSRFKDGDGDEGDW